MEDDLHPDIDEIKPFVGIGPTEDFSITVHKRTFDTGFIIVTIIFILLIVTVLILCIFFATKETEIQPSTPLPLTTTSSNSVENFGGVPFATYSKDLSSSISETYSRQNICESNNRMEWNNDTCTCKSQYFGPNCQFEKHDQKYFGVGNPNEDKIKVSLLDEIVSNGKSFNENGNTNSCSKLCDAEKDCVGFIYHDPGVCTLLTGNIIIPENDNIAYRSDVSPTLYLKSSDNLKFEGRIFLAEFPYYFPPRYWMVKESYHYLQLFPREISELTFYPNYMVTAGCYMGIYCLYPFKIDDVPILLSHQDRDRCYIHHPKTILDVPDHWRYRLPIYVVYLPT